MATFTADAAKATAATKGVGHGSQEVAVYAEYEITAALAANDVIQMVKVPAGARITWVHMGSEDLDTGGSPAIVLDVGDGDDTDRHIDGATIAQSGGVTAASAMRQIGYKYTSADTIDVICATAPATGATSGKISLCVKYLVED